MQERFDLDPRPPDHRAVRNAPPELTVSALNALVKDMLESRIPPVWVEGEISGWKRHSSGHRYFCLRDGGAQINAVMWRSDAQRLPVEPTEGMRIRAFGSVTLYERRGDFQFVVRRVDDTGMGGPWKLAFEGLRSRLEAEGLLAPERKRRLPRYPISVGVVTSPAGAVLHDILEVIGRRAPWTRVVLSPARVQGDGAAADVARALARVDRAGVDVIIVGRGGGSVEDLWAFNEEPVARAIAACTAPVISAVGHEVDVTIADLVADLRAPTPSAAAEHAVPDGAELRQQLHAARDRLARALGRYADRRREQIDMLAERLHGRGRRLVEQRMSTLQWAEERLAQRTRRLLDRRSAEVSTLAAQLHALSPLQALTRGFAVPLDGEGHVLRSVAAFHEGMPFRLRVADGTVPCRVEEETGE